MPIINYQCTDKSARIENTENLSILELSQREKIPHLHECGGHGRCTTCRVRILNGAENLSPPTKIERIQAESRHWGNDTRLACQTFIQGDVTLQRLIKTGAEISQLQLESLSQNEASERDLTLLFCDMRNFTPFVERNMAFDVVHIMNRLYSSLGDAILLNNGMIYQYVGDEIVAMFGLGDEPPQDSAMKAVRAAMYMLQSIERLDEDIKELFDQTVEVGIGIHCGRVVAGHFGHPTDRRFSIIGDAINVASRIQGANKELQTHCLISDDVFKRLSREELVLGKSKSVALKGKSETIKVHEVTGFAKPDNKLLVQSTWNTIQKNELDFGEIFYQHLFKIAPELYNLFSGNMSAQSNMLAQMLDTLIYSSERPEYLVSGLYSLGKRHIQYGVKPEHYGLVKRALMQTLEKILQDQFSPLVQKAWDDTLETIMSLMQKPD